MRRPASSGDFLSGLALAALGTYVVVEAHGWIYMGEDGPGPGFFPTWYGSIMVLLSLALVVRSLRAPAGAPAGPVRWREVGRALMTWAAFVACIALMNWIGFAVSFALLTWFLITVLARKRQRVAIPLAIAGAVLFQVVFSVLLQVNLPNGVFF
ncbi:MAG TPA: tripartite tricarboxylate transporter TctB family protein [Usitatibacter sp.]|nr:tripartite tricarboxylate transporter TctB family protein [Usitatibacter sp.]